MVADPGVSLRHAANQYCTSLPSQQRGEEQQEVDRFIRWCGRDRAARELTPLEIEQYGAWVAMESADPATRLTSVRSFLGYLKKKNMVSVPYDRVTCVASADEGIMFKTSEITLITAAGRFAFQFRGADKAHWAYEFIMSQILK